MDWACGGGVPAGLGGGAWVGEYQRKVRKLTAGSNGREGDRRRELPRGADASVGRVTIGLSEEGFLLGVGCTSEGSITRGLGAGALLGSGGGGGLVVLQTCHETRWSSVRWARLERR